ncbi:MAG TPA: hypothetical protein ENJ20_07320 [Bacteroidetes bacterium]|nr:hypothetical protein [Bacteroidota bacterium]
MKETTNKGKGKKSLDMIKKDNGVDQSTLQNAKGGSRSESNVSKKRSYFSWLIGPKPCDGDLPL